MVEAKKITVGGFEYSIGRLSAFDALHVARVLAPISPALVGGVMDQLVSAVTESKDESEAELADKLFEVSRLLQVCEPVLMRLSMMNRDDFESVVKTCLTACERRTERSWARVVQNGVIIFDDVDLVTVVTLVAHVIAIHIRPIIAALCQSKAE